MLQSAPKKFSHYYNGGITLPEEIFALIEVENGLLHLEFEVEKEKRKYESYRLRNICTFYLIKFTRLYLN